MPTENNFRYRVKCYLKDGRTLDECFRTLEEAKAQAFRWLAWYYNNATATIDDRQEGQLFHCLKSCELRGYPYERQP